MILNGGRDLEGDSLIRLSWHGDCSESVGRPWRLASTDGDGADSQGERRRFLSESGVTNDNHATEVLARYAQELSAGMQQRVTADELQDELMALWRIRKKTVLMVTPLHFRKEAMCAFAN